MTKSGVMSGQVGVNGWILSVEPQRGLTLVSQTIFQNTRCNLLQEILLKGKSVTPRSETFDVYCLYCLRSVNQGGVPLIIPQVYQAFSVGQDRLVKQYKNKRTFFQCDCQEPTDRWSENYTLETVPQTSLHLPLVLPTQKSCQTEQRVSMDESHNSTVQC